MNKEKFKEKYGSWALITGASSGIGEEFARQIARLGLNVVMVARRKENMEVLGREFREQFGIEYRAIAMDLSREGFYEELEPQVSDLDIGLLVNNAGINCEGDFYRGGIERDLRMMRLNMEASFILAYNFGKKFIEKGRGGIVFVGSTSSFQASPYLTHYAATKAYILSLAEGMNYEFRDKGVDVIALCPGPTVSEMSPALNGMPYMMKAEPVVMAALNNLGKKIHVVPGVANKLGAALPQVFGRRLSMEMVGSVLKVALPANKKKKRKEA